MRYQNKYCCQCHKTTRHDVHTWSKSKLFTCQSCGVLTSKPKDERANDLLFRATPRFAF